MRKYYFPIKRLHIIGISLVSLILLMSYSNNPPNGKTNAPGDGYCTECHGSGNPGGFDGNITITGLPDTTSPGETYPLTITVSNPNGLAGRAGFQLVVLNSSNQNFGTLTSTDPNGAVTPSGSRTYFEHDPSQLFNGSNEASWFFNWEAPSVSGQESFTIYAAANIANNNGDNDGDYIISRTFNGLVLAQPDPLEVTVSGTNISCNGQNNGMATANPTGGTLPYTYAWSSGQSTQTINGLPPGNYTVTVSDAGNQTASASIQITQPDPLTSSISASGTEINCNVTTITLTAAASGGSLPYGYLWSTGAQTSIITVTSGGTYSVTVSDQNQCSSVSSVTITENLNLDVSLLPIDPVCENHEPVPLFGSPAGGVYSGPGVNGSTFDPSIAGPGNHEIIYTYSEGQCSDFASQTAVVEALPSINIVPVNDLCLTDPAINVIASPSGGIFSGPGITSDGVFTPSQAGIGTHTITYTINGLCVAFGTTQIKVKECNCNTPVTVQAGPDISLCAGDIIIINGQGTNASSYHWSSNGDGSFINPDSLRTTYIPGENDKTNGMVTLTLTGADPDGDGPCTGDADELVLTINPIPDITFETAKNVCEDLDSLLLIATPSGGTWSGVGVSGNVFHFDTLGVGFYTLQYSVENTHGCFKKDSVEIEVKDCSNLFTGELFINKNNCAYDSIANIQVIPGDDATEPITYIWSNGDTTQTIEHLANGNYSVTATDALGKTLTLEGTVTSLSNLSILQDESVTCTSDSLACPVVKDGVGPIQYLWSNSNTNPCQELIRDSILCLTISDSLSCKQSVCISYFPLTIHVDEIIEPTDVSGSIDITVSGGEPGYTFTWLRDTTLIATTEDLDSIYAPGVYTIHVTDASGCETSEKITLEGGAIAKESKIVDHVYPNPFKNEILLEAANPSAVKEVIIITPLNNYVRKHWDSTSGNTMKIEMENMPSGVYYLIVLEKGVVKHFKLMKI